MGIVETEQARELLDTRINRARRILESLLDGCNVNQFQVLLRLTIHPVGLLDRWRVAAH